MAYVTPGIVLRHANFGDYDRMVTLLTPERGRLEVAARGCRRLKSPLVNAAELFTSGEYTIQERNGRGSIQQCQISDSFFPLRTDYERLVHGIYWLKLLDALIVPGAPAEQVFHMTLRALAHLSYSELPAALLTMAFEMHLMAIEGFLPRVDACVICQAALEGEARFDARRGGAVCVGCERHAPPISYGARRIIYRLPQTPFEAVAKLVDHPDWREAAQLFRAYISQRVSVKAKHLPALSTGDE